jgi:hypothetical protein
LTRRLFWLLLLVLIVPGAVQLTLEFIYVPMAALWLLPLIALSIVWLSASATYTARGDAGGLVALRAYEWLSAAGSIWVTIVDAMNQLPIGAAIALVTLGFYVYAIVITEGRRFQSAFIAVKS